MLAWLSNVNIAILVSHVSWNVLTSSTLLAQPCICTVVLNGHAPISNLEMLHGVSAINTTISVLHCFCLLDLKEFSWIPWNHKFRSLLLAASLRGGVSLSMLLAVLFAPEIPHLLARNVTRQIIYLYFQSFCSLKKHFLFFGIQISELSSGCVIVWRFTRHDPCNKSISWELEEGNAVYTCPAFDSLLHVDVAILFDVWPARHAILLAPGSPRITGSFHAALFRLFTCSDCIFQSFRSHENRSFLSFF